MFYFFWGKENRSFYLGLRIRYIEVCYIEVPLYLTFLNAVIYFMSTFLNRLIFKHNLLQDSLDLKISLLIL